MYTRDRKYRIKNIRKMLLFFLCFFCFCFFKYITTKQNNNINCFDRKLHDVYNTGCGCLLRIPLEIMSMNPVCAYLLHDAVTQSV